MNVLVAYESRTGTTERTARAIARACEAGGHEVRLRAVADTASEDVRWAEAMLYGTWVDGLILFGVHPATAAVSALGRLPRMHDLPVAAFCTYAVNPRGALSSLAGALERRGALVLAKRAFRRTQADAWVMPFVGDFLSAVYAHRAAARRRPAPDAASETAPAERGEGEAAPAEPSPAAPGAVS